MFSFFSYQVKQANFTLEALSCPGGYILEPQASEPDISVCTCNEFVPEVILCKDDQDTVIIQVKKRKGEKKVEKYSFFILPTERQVGSVCSLSRGG